MAFSNQLFFLFVLLLSVSSISHGADLIAKECGNTSTNADILLGNINTIILDLVAMTTANSSAESTYGSGNDTVYGTAECRADITSQDCSGCIIDAGQAIRTSCANTTESRIWYHQCSLRYSTTNFFGKPDTNRIGVWTSAGMMTDPQTFKQALKELLVVVTTAASSGESRKFGWGEIESNSLTNNETITIHEMAQCTADLQGPECLNCLDAAYSVLQSDCGEHNGCFIILKSCAIRYEVTPFLFLNAAPDPAIITNKITFANI